MGKDLRCPICNPKITCPHCGKEGESYWLICPHCEGAFGEKSALDKRLAGIRILFQGFGGVAFICVVTAIVSLFATGKYLECSFSCMALLVLGLASLGLTVWQTQDNPRKRTRIRYGENFLLVIGLFVTFSCLLGLTYVLYLVASCNFKGRPSSTSKKPASQNIDKVTSEPSDEEPEE
jgi:hypothetical protein